MSERQPTRVAHIGQTYTHTVGVGYHRYLPHNNQILTCRSYTVSTVHNPPTSPQRGSILFLSFPFHILIDFHIRFDTRSSGLISAGLRGFLQLSTIRLIVQTGSIRFQEDKSATFDIWGI